MLARVLGQHMSQTLGQSIVVEDVTGAGGTLGSARAAKAAPDGYTLVMGNIGTHAASVGLYKNLSYDPRTDFEPVMVVATTPMVLVTKKDLPVTTLSDVIALAKQRKITLGSAGTGSASHLTLLLFVSLTQADVQHVPYRGLSQAMNDLLAGPDRDHVRPGDLVEPAHPRRRRQADRRDVAEPRQGDPQRADLDRGRPARSADHSPGPRCSRPRARRSRSSSGSTRRSTRP